jgi:hypothetical protein
MILRPTKNNILRSAADLKRLERNIMNVVVASQRVKKPFRNVLRWFFGKLDDVPADKKTECVAL